MNVVDLILLVVFLISLLVGFRNGFIIGMINLVVWLGSIAAGFYLYQPFGRQMQQWFPQLNGLALPLAFLIVVVASRLLLAIIFNKILHRSGDSLHAQGANKFLGIIPGAINGIIYTTVIAAFFLSVPLSDTVSATTRDSKIAAELGNNVTWLSHHLSPMFDSGFKRTINGGVIEPKPDETIRLNFTVKNASPRPDLEAEMLVLINKERTSRGLKPLQADTALLPVARDHSNDMFARGYFSHYTLEGKDPFDRMKTYHIKYMAAGENLALGQTLQTCHQGLMNSPGHRANILNTAYGRVGIGILDGGFHGLMISQEFRN